MVHEPIACECVSASLKKENQAFVEELLLDAFGLRLKPWIIICHLYCTANYRFQPYELIGRERANDSNEKLKKENPHK